MTYDPQGAFEDAGAATELLDPESISSQTFTESPHGYETEEVDAYLAELAAFVREVRAREHELELRIADLERQLDDVTERASSVIDRSTANGAGHAITSLEDLDEGDLAELVGVETAKVLSAARNAAAGIVANAERTAAQMRSKADRDAERVVADAEERLENAAREADAEAARRLNEADTAIGLATAEAQQQAERASAEAEAKAAEIEASARRRLEEAQDEASSIIDRAKSEARTVVEKASADGQGLIAEAQSVRAETLEELVRRRKVLRRQVEQLHAGRERLASTFAVVHDSMAIIDRELDTVLAEARDAAEEAANRADRTVDPAASALEEMARSALTAAKRIGGEPAEPRTVDADAEAEDAAGAVFSRLKAGPPDDLSAPPGLSEEETELRDKLQAASGAAPPTHGLRPSSPISGGDPNPAAGACPAIDDELSTVRDKLLDDLKKDAVRRMKRRLTEEQNELLDTIRRERPLPELDAFLAPEAEHERRYAEAVLPALRNAAGAGSELGGALIASKPPPESPEMPESLESLESLEGPESPESPESPEEEPREAANVVDVAAVLAVEVVGTLRTRLEGCMAGEEATRLRSTTDKPRAAATKTGLTAAANALCDEVKFAYREIRNHTVDISVSAAILEAFTRGASSAAHGREDHLDQLLDRLLDGLPRPVTNFT